MASMASNAHFRHYQISFKRIKQSRASNSMASHIKVPVVSQQQRQENEEDHHRPPNQTPLVLKGRREIMLRCSEIAVLGAIFNFSGAKPSYLGVQKNPAGLALCPATNNCVSTSENISDLTHYAPPWNYNPGGKRQVTREKAMEELLLVIKSTKPDNFTPKITEKKDDYIRVEYESPIMGFVDDVEFWFAPGKKPIVQYRSASRLGNFDFFYINKKRIKALRQALEKKGWVSENSI